MLLSLLGGNERRVQLLQIHGFDVGNGPELKAALPPGGHIVTILTCRAGQGGAAVDRTHKHVDDVLTSSIDDSCHHPSMHIVEPPADQRESPVGEIRYRGRKVHLARKPGFHYMVV